MNFLAEPLLAPDGLGTFALGMRLDSPLGLAAGYDRYGDRLSELARSGFGFVELGTLTPSPPAGDGVAQVAARLAAFRAAAATDGPRCVIGMNVACDPGLPDRSIAPSYAAALATAWEVADYIVLNFTAHWTRPLLQPAVRSEFDALLARLADETRRLVSVHRRAVPLVAKAPLQDCLADSARLSDSLIDAGCAGILAAVAGRDDPVLPRRRTDALYRELVSAIGKRSTVLAVGGIRDADDVLRRLDCGVHLLQVFSAYAAHGASWITRTHGALAKRQRAGLPGNLDTQLTARGCSDTVLQRYEHIR